MTPFALTGLKMQILAEISVMAEFRHSGAVSYGYGVSAKNIFRSHTKKKEAREAFLSDCGFPGFPINVVGVVAPSATSPQSPMPSD